uniref:C2H2-type domain-containing protein n=1 Tax=Mesocestoides corti TaxID=53468 RepID=A0A5K3FGT6_MESCO
MDASGEFACKICNLTCNSAEQLRSHQSGKSHIKKCGKSFSESEQRLAIYYVPFQTSPVVEHEDLMTCVSCNKQCLPAEMLSHVCEPTFYGSTDSCLGSSFSSTLSPTTSTEAPSPASQPSSLSPETVSKRPYFCHACDVQLNSQVDFDLHVTGRRHKNRSDEISLLVKQADGERCCGNVDVPPSSLLVDLVVEGGDHSYIDSTFPASSALVRGPTALSSFCATPSDGVSPYYCATCRVSLNSKQFDSHVNGRGHRSKAVAVSERLGDPLLYGIVDQSRCLSKSRSSSDGIDYLSLNSILCDLCNVPVTIQTLPAHNKGRAHLWNAAMADCATVCKTELTEPRLVQRKFSATLNYLIESLALTGIKPTRLVELAHSETNAILRLSKAEEPQVTQLGLLTVLSLVRANCAAISSPHCFAVWICARKEDVARRFEEAHRLASASRDPVCILNVQKKDLCVGGLCRGITQHDVHFSTPGGFSNLLEEFPNLQNAVCAILFTDVEQCFSNDPTERLLGQYVRPSIELSKQARVIVITTEIVPPLATLRSFSTFM